MISALNRLADGTIELTITIPWPRVKTEYEKVVAAAVAKTELKGFRQGKAPRELVEKQLDKSKLYEEVIRQLVPTVYVEAVKEHQVKPIVNPQIKVLALEENKDWQIQAITCEMPIVELGQYQQEIKKGGGGENKDQKLEKIFQALLQTAKITLPHLLIGEEVNRMLARLIDQTGRLGLTIDQYLASVNKTNDQLRAEYTHQAEETLKLEVILGQIAQKENVEVTEEEIAKMITAAPDEASRQQIEAPEQKLYLKQLVRKQKVIENLLKL